MIWLVGYLVAGVVVVLVRALVMIGVLWLCRRLGNARAPSTTSHPLDWVVELVLWPIVVILLGWSLWTIAWRVGSALWTYRKLRRAE